MTSNVTCADQNTAGSEPWHLANSMVGLSSMALILEFVVVVLFQTGWLERRTRWVTLGVYVLTVVVSTTMFGVYVSQHDIGAHMDCHMTRAALGLSIVMWCFFLIGVCCGVPLGLLAEADSTSNDRDLVLVKDVEAPHMSERLLPTLATASVGRSERRYRFRYHPSYQ